MYVLLSLIQSYLYQIQLQFQHVRDAQYLHLIAPHSGPLTPQTLRYTAQKVSNMLFPQRQHPLAFSGV